MNKFIGLVILGCALVVGFGSIAGCPKKKEDKKDPVTKDEGKKDEGKKDEGKKDEGKKDEKKDEGKKDEKKDEKKKAPVVAKLDPVTLKQGETKDVKVSVDTKAAAPLKVNFDKLPAGVSAEPKDPSIAANSDSVTVKLKAADDAPAVANHKATVTVAGAEPPGMQELTITVNKK